MVLGKGPAVEAFWLFWGLNLQPLNSWLELLLTPIARLFITLIACLIYCRNNTQLRQYKYKNHVTLLAPVLPTQHETTTVRKHVTTKHTGKKKTVV